MYTIERILEAKGSEVHLVHGGVHVIDAVKAMCRAQVGAVLVMDGDRLAGIFSERDLMKRVVLARLDPARTPVSEVMTKDVVCIEQDVSPSDAMALMTNRRVRHLPVVDGRRIVGIVSIGDFVRSSLHEREEEIAQLQDYVAGRYPG